MLQLLLISVLIFSSCKDQELARFTVTAADHDFQDRLVTIELTSVVKEPSGKMVLVKSEREDQSPIPFQLYTYDKATWITFRETGTKETGSSREYILKKAGDAGEMKAHASIAQNDDELIITDHDQPVLPPAGVDTSYKGSAYIHPLYSPGGMVLTRIQPPDHYHHYGIWNPWTKTHINGREIDYWNLAKGQGTVRTEAILSTLEEPLYTSFAALHHHIDKGHEEGERVTMEEFWEVTYWGKVAGGNRYILDLQTTLRNVLQDTILFDAYRYGGGLGYRSTGEWNNENSTVLTSEGKDRSNADGTRARWCIVEGISTVPEGRSGILFMSHPDNREHPEPMRVWPPDSNNGELFFEFCPIRHKEWVIEPAKDYTLKYRMLVFDGTVTSDEADRYWNTYAYGE